MNATPALYVPRDPEKVEAMRIPEVVTPEFEAFLRGKGHGTPKWWSESRPRPGEWLVMGYGVGAIGLTDAEFHARYRPADEPGEVERLRAALAEARMQLRAASMVSEFDEESLRQANDAIDAALAGGA